MMYTPATALKRPASSPLNAEASQPTDSVEIISPPCNQLPTLVQLINF